jgi:hypothetical protein
MKSALEKQAHEARNETQGLSLKPEEIGVSGQVVDRSGSAPYSAGQSFQRQPVFSTCRIPLMTPRSLTLCAPVRFFRQVRFDCRPEVIAQPAQSAHPRRHRNFEAKNLIC